MKIAIKNIETKKEKKTEKINIFPTLSPIKADLAADEKKERERITAKHDKICTIQPFKTPQKTKFCDLYTKPPSCMRTRKVH